MVSLTSCNTQAYEHTNYSTLLKMQGCLVQTVTLITHTDISQTTATNKTTS